MKKVLLLFWKIILLTLGGMETLRLLRKEYRKQAGLEDTDEDTIEITRNMRSSSPPTSGTDVLETQHQKRAARVIRRSFLKQNSLDEPGLEMGDAVSFEIFNYNDSIFIYIQ